jgi:hypothetical protein
MFWFGLFLVILGTILGTLTFTLFPNRNTSEWKDSLGLYCICFGLIAWGAYVLYPVST